MDVNILGSSITKIKENPNKDLLEFCSLIKKESDSKGGGKLKGCCKFKEDIDHKKKLVQTGYLTAEKHFKTINSQKHTD